MTLNSDDQRFVKNLQDFNKIEDGSADADFYEEQILEHIGKNLEKYDFLLRQSAEDKVRIFKEYLNSGASDTEIARVQTIVNLENAISKWILSKAKAKHKKIIKNN